jgi:phage-related protein
MATAKPLVWMGDSRESVREFPKEVRMEVGVALWVAQNGGKHVTAKPLKGIEAVEIVSNYESDTFRAVYTVKLAGFVYVLHCYQKKSKRGIATPRTDVELIRRRLRDAKEDHARRIGKSDSGQRQRVR